MTLFKHVMAATVSVALATSAFAQSSRDTLSPLVQVLAQTEDAQVQLDILKGISDGLKGQGRVMMPTGWEAASKKLSQSPNAKVQELTKNLSLIFGSSAALADLREQLKNSSAKPADRINALQALVAAKDSQLEQLLPALLNDAAVRGAAIKASGAFAEPSIARILVQVYPGLSAAEKRDALIALASRVSHARTMLSAVEQNRIDRKDLSADIVRQLRDLNQADITQQVEKVWGTIRATPAEKIAEIAKYKKLIQTPGRRDDAMNGRAIYTRTCGQCHTLYGEGGKIGPDITGSNRADLDYILHNILDPNAEIPLDYKTSTVEMKDDRVITGIIKQQTEQVITIASANETLSLPRKDVAAIRPSELSMMPEGLVEQLTEKEVGDLIAYLATKGQVPMLATKDNVDQFFNGKNLDGWSGAKGNWKVENGELIGTSPALKKNEWLVAPLAVGDFRLIVEVKLAPNAGNSGIQFRSEALPDGEVKGYQADIGVGWWGKLYEEHGRALLWKEDGDKHVKKDDWNTYEIVAVGSHIKTAINGQTCVDMEDTAGKRQGIIAFQLHSGNVPFEIRLRKVQLELNPLKAELKTGKSR
ncbi:MAG TPA: family 16 glycoside hydrolase [Verrucomicrobiae bacterium]